MDAGFVPTALVTGTIGSGKTAVATDMVECLGERNVAAAAVDLDWLGWVTHISPAAGTAYELILRNLEAIWPNLREAGVSRVVLVRAIQVRAELDRLRETLPEAEIKVVRLTASPEAIESRLNRRDTGAILKEHLGEAAEFTQLLDEMRIEDFEVANEGRSVREVALDVLGRLGWA